MSIPSSDQKQLDTHEWLTVTLILSIMGFLTIYSYLNTTWVSPSNQKHLLYSPEIEVYVHGAVEHPGPIRIKRESTFNDLLKQIAVKPNADLKKKRLQTKLKAGQTILIPEKKESRRGKRKH